MLGELVPCGGGDPIPLLKPRLLVGRRTSCDISLRFPNVSSHHCEVELSNGYWRVRDLGSRNGIKVNGIRCDTKWLMPGDVLSVARHRYEVIYEPQTDGPPPEDDDPMAIGLMEKAGLVSREPDESDRSSSEQFDALVDALEVETEDDIEYTENDIQFDVEANPSWLEDDNESD